MNLRLAVEGTSACNLFWRSYGNSVIFRSFVCSENRSHMRYEAFQDVAADVILRRDGVAANTRNESAHLILAGIILVGFIAGRLANDTVDAFYELRSLGQDLDSFQNPLICRGRLGRCQRISNSRKNLAKLDRFNVSWAASNF